MHIFSGRCYSSSSSSSSSSLYLWAEALTSVMCLTYKKQLYTFLYFHRKKKLLEKNWLWPTLHFSFLNKIWRKECFTWMKYVPQLNQRMWRTCIYPLGRNPANRWFRRRECRTWRAQSFRCGSTAPSDHAAPPRPPVEDKKEETIMSSPVLFSNSILKSGGKKRTSVCNLRFFMTPTKPLSKAIVILLWYYTWRRLNEAAITNSRR